MMGLCCRTNLIRMNPNIYDAKLLGLLGSLLCLVRNLWHPSDWELFSLFWISWIRGWRSVILLCTAVVAIWSNDLRLWVELSNDPLVLYFAFLQLPILTLHCIILCFSFGCFRFDPFDLLLKLPCNLFSLLPSSPLLFILYLPPLLSITVLS